MRVRIRRFELLRLRSKPRDSHSVVVARRQCVLERLVPGHLPPASGVEGGNGGGVLGYIPCAQLAKDRPSSLPLLELDEPQPVADPLVEAGEDAGRIREPEVLLPTREVASQLRDHDREGPATVPGGDLPDAFLHRFKSLGRDAPLHLPPRGYPEAVA